MSGVALLVSGWRAGKGAEAGIGAAAALSQAVSCVRSAFVVLNIAVGELLSRSRATCGRL